jgi:hypothetical protein
MGSFITRSKDVSVLSVKITERTLTVDLQDGRSISAPLSWYPRLLHGSPAERNNWRVIGRGEGIHWPDLDEDISVSGLLEGTPSQESPASLQEWLSSRRMSSHE